MLMTEEPNIAFVSAWGITSLLPLIRTLWHCTSCVWQFILLNLNNVFFIIPVFYWSFVALPNLSPNDIYSRESISQMPFCKITEHLDSINILIEIQIFNSLVTSCYLKNLFVNIRRIILNKWTAITASKNCFHK